MLPRANGFAAKEGTHVATTKNVQQTIDDLPGDATLRQTGQRVHPHLLPSASPNRLLRLRGRLRSVAQAAATAAATTPVPAPQPGSPGYLLQAYDLAALAQTAGGNQTIAIVDAFDNPRAEADMATYRAQFGLPACTSASGCFTKVNEFGNAQPLPSKCILGW